jgi:sterol desaturase/sphingolipid hydroxylase (fatty acid hydroxylase superfamily)
MSPDHEGWIALAFYAPIILAMVLETVAPRRAPVRSTAMRWFHIGGLGVINATVAWCVASASALVVATTASEHGWGLLPALRLSEPFAFVTGLLLLDLASYFKHRAYHAWPVLWQLHVVHHSDADMDVGTGLRHHPADYLLDGFLTAGVVVVLGVSVESVLTFLVLATAHNAFRHGNFIVPRWLDGALRHTIVTPDWHRVHHSSLELETNSNFGGVLTWWDRLFGTYRAQPERGHEDMQLGLEYFRDPAENRLISMLTQPLRQPKAREAAPQGVVMR